MTDQHIARQITGWVAALGSSPAATGSSPAETVDNCID
jgi:hypothetical protein